MFKRNFVKTLIIKITSAAVAVILIVAALPAQSSAASSGYSEKDFVIKLKAADIQPLLNLGLANSAIEKKFAFSQSDKFKNIYGFRSDLSIADLKQSLSGLYEYLEVDQAAKAGVEALTANDPGFTLNPANIDKQWGLVKTGFPLGWNRSKGSSSVVVAVIDTGIDQTHEDFSKTNFVSGYDFITHKLIPVGTNSDDHGHGTLVAGVIGATPDNNKGIAGTNWDVSLMPLKALNSSGAGNASDISEAIVWAADHNAKVINMSVGGIGFAHDTTLANAISYAYYKNVVLVSAAGNDVATTGGNLDENPVFPICDDNGENMIIGVVAIDQNDVKPEFSNFGRACLDVAAPGKRILSTINHDPITGVPSANAYAYASGTSLAVPFVSGQAALLKAALPSITNQQIRDLIISTAENIDDKNPIQCGGYSCRGMLGAGRINVLKSLEQEAATATINDGDLVRVGSNGAVYLISGGKKKLISPFVKSQRFAAITPKTASDSDLRRFPDGPYAEPLDGTLVKADKNPTVYYMSGGLRLPVTAQVYKLRNLQNSVVNTLSDSEISSWLVGSFLTPPDGALVRGYQNQTVYWVVGGVLHGINFGFYQDRGLQIFPVILVSDNDIRSYPKGDPYIR